MPSGSIIASASGSVQSKSDWRNEASPSPTTPVANDILVQRRRNKKTAVRFFRRLRKGQGREPRWLVTDKLRNDDAAHRAVMPTVEHSNAAYANTRADVSHQPTRQQEYHLRGVASSIQAQRLGARSCNAIYLAKTTYMLSHFPAELKFRLSKLKTKLFSLYGTARPAPKPELVLSPVNDLGWC